jgi:hypothetical protein
MTDSIASIVSHSSVSISIAESPLAAPMQMQTPASGHRDQMSSSMSVARRLQYRVQS